MRRLIVLLASGILATGLVAPNVYSSPSDLSLTDEFLMTFDVTYNIPGYTAGLFGTEDVEGLGVEFDVGLAGFGEVNVGLGAPSPVADLSAYNKYLLTFTNTSTDDFFSTNLYIKTGEGLTMHESGWATLMPGMSIDMAMNLTGVSDLDDVREIGFGLKAYLGQGFGLADGIQVKAEDDEDATLLGRETNPVPEASTLMLFGSGLVGLLAIAKRRLPFLSK